MTAWYHSEGIKRGEVLSAHTVKGFRGSGGVAPVILTLGTRSRVVVSLEPRIAQAVALSQHGIVAPVSHNKFIPLLKPSNVFFCNI